MKRRRPDNLERQIMKSQAKELWEERQREKRRYIKEKHMRMQAEKTREQMEQTLHEYQENLETYRVNLQQAEETTDLLAEKALVAEEESRLLLKKAADLEEEVKRLHLAISEKDKEKIYLESHMQDIEQVVKQSEMRAQELRLLRQQLDDSRSAEKIATDKLMQLSASQTQQFLPYPQPVPFTLPQEQPHIMQPQPQQGIMISGIGEGETSEYIKSLQQEGDEYLKKSNNLQHKLTDIKTAIEGLRIMGSTDRLDRLHIESVGKGENKYSTLQKLQASSTNARVQVYQRL